MVDIDALEPDLERITIIEYRKLFDKETPQDEEDEIVARTYGLTIADIQGMSVLSYKKLVRKFYKRAGEPLADPN